MYMPLQINLLVSLARLPLVLLALDVPAHVPPIASVIPPLLDRVLRLMPSLRFFRLSGGRIYDTHTIYPGKPYALDNEPATTVFGAGSGESFMMTLQWCIIDQPHGARIVEALSDGEWARVDELLQAARSPEEVEGVYSRCVYRALRHQYSSITRSLHVQPKGSYGIGLVGNGRRMILW